MMLYGVTGWKNAGKTGLMERLITEMTGRGLTVSTVKHAHHSFDVDQPGRDSYRHRMAGAGEVLLVSDARIALMQELRGAPEPPLADLLERLSPVDLVLIEGYKRDRHPKIGDGVLIGAGAKVLGNIRIGARSRIAAGSVVLSDIPACVTVAGVPARIVGSAGCNEPAEAMEQRIDAV